MSIKVDEMSTRVERIEEDVRDHSMVKDEAVERVKKLEDNLEDLFMLRDELVMLKKVPPTGALGLLNQYFL